VIKIKLSFIFWVALQFFLIGLAVYQRNWVFLLLVMGIFLTGIANTDIVIKFKCKHKKIIKSKDGTTFCRDCGKILDGE